MDLPADDEIIEGSPSDVTAEAETEAPLAVETNPAVAPVVPEAAPAVPEGAKPQGASNILLLQQRIREMEAREQQRESENRAQQYAAEIQRYQLALEGQGLEPAVVEQHVRSMQDLPTEREQLYTQRQQLEERYNLRLQDHEAKMLIAGQLSKQYGVPLAELLGAKSPMEMENIGLKAQLARGTQATLKPSPTDNNRGGGAGGNRNTRIEQLTDKSSLTDKEHQELGRLMSTGR